MREVASKCGRRPAIKGRQQRSEGALGRGNSPKGSACRLVGFLVARPDPCWPGSCLRRPSSPSALPSTPGAALAAICGALAGQSSPSCWAGIEHSPPGGPGVVTGHLLCHAPTTRRRSSTFANPHSCEKACPSPCCNCAHHLRGATLVRSRRLVYCAERVLAEVGQFAALITWTHRHEVIDHGHAVFVR